MKYAHNSNDCTVIRHRNIVRTYVSHQEGAYKLETRGLRIFAGGLGNAANAAVLYLFPEQTSTGSAIRASTRQIVTTQTTLSFLLLSFVAGALIVALVIISAVLAQKNAFPHLPFRKGEEDSLE